MPKYYVDRRTGTTGQALFLESNPMEAEIQRFLDESAPARDYKSENILAALKHDAEVLRRAGLEKGDVLVVGCLNQQLRPVKRNDFVEHFYCPEPLLVRYVDVVQAKDQYYWTISLQDIPVESHRECLRLFFERYGQYADVSVAEVSVIGEASAYYISGIISGVLTPLARIMNTVSLFIAPGGTVELNKGIFDKFPRVLVAKYGNTMHAAYRLVEDPAMLTKVLNTYGKNCRMTESGGFSVISHPDGLQVMEGNRHRGCWEVGDYILLDLATHSSIIHKTVELFKNLEVLGYEPIRTGHYTHRSKKSGERVAIFKHTGDIAALETFLNSFSHIKKSKLSVVPGKGTPPKDNIVENGDVRFCVHHGTEVMIFEQQPYIYDKRVSFTDTELDPIPTVEPAPVSSVPEILKEPVPNYVDSAGNKYYAHLCTDAESLLKFLEPLHERTARETPAPPFSAEVLPDKRIAIWSGQLIRLKVPIGHYVVIKVGEVWLSSYNPAEFNDEFTAIETAKPVETLKPTHFDKLGYAHYVHHCADQASTQRFLDALGDLAVPHIYKGCKNVVTLRDGLLVVTTDNGHHRQNISVGDYLAVADGSAWLHMYTVKEFLTELTPITKTEEKAPTMSTPCTDETPVTLPTAVPYAVGNSALHDMVCKLQEANPNCVVSATVTPGSTIITFKVK